MFGNISFRTDYLNLFEEFSHCIVYLVPEFRPHPYMVIKTFGKID